MSEEIEINELELFDNLIMSQWDDIEDLPDFVTPPLGDYLFEITKCEKGTSKDKTQGAIKIIGALKEVVELARPDEDVAPPIGSLCGAAYYGELGVKRFKKIFKDAAIALGANSPAEMIETLQGATLAVTIRHRADSEKVDPNTGKPVVYAEWASVIAG